MHIIPLYIFKKICQKNFAAGDGAVSGIKKLFGPLLDDLDCVSAIKEAM
jgi:hypothetical protein